jgi:clan AA aspartic protease
MIRGVVNARLEAVASLRIRGPAGTELDVDAVVDSGFSAALTLPKTTIAALGLARQSAGGAALADGSFHQFDVYAGDVEWNGNWRAILVWAVGGEALIGMQLLAGHELRIEVVPGGAVEITRMP